jgi:hypothetical protein
VGPLIEILAFYGLFGSISSNFGYVFLASGKPRYITLWIGAVVLFEVVLIALGSRFFGLTGAATGMLIGMIIPFPFVAIALSRLLGLTGKDWLCVARRPILSTAVMAFTVEGWWSATAGWWPVTSAVAPLVSSITVGALAYAGCCIALWWRAGKPDGPEKYLAERIKALLVR